MKLIVSIVTFCFIICNSTFCNNDTIYYNHLFYTCKVWGFIKYFHSEVAKCNIDWDSVLIANIPNIKNSNNNIEFNESLSILINGIGETEIPTTPPPPVIPDSLSYNLNLDWMDNNIFSDEIKEVLDTIFHRFRPRDHCLVDSAFLHGNPVFDNDCNYYSTSGYFPEESVRILALFRYWNIINYFFPYKYLMDNDWDITLAEFIPDFVEAKSDIEYNLALIRMSTYTNDTHARTTGGKLTQIFGNLYPKFNVGYIENKTVITKVDSSVNKIQTGDIIHAIEGTDIVELRDSLKQYAIGSNDLAINYKINQMILKGSFGTFPMTVERDTEMIQVILSRPWTDYYFYSFLQNTGPIWYDTLINNKCLFGYVDMERLEVSHVKEMMVDLWNSHTIIFDLRNYPQGTLYELIKYLFYNPIHIANGLIPDINFPGTQYWKEVIIGDYSYDVFNGNISILINERTMSHAEFTCMGLELYPGSLKIGNQTSGADGNVSKIYLPGHIITKFSGLGIYYPDYSQTQRIGITPDIEVIPSIEGIQNGEDEVLSYAFNCSYGTDGGIKKEKIKLYVFPNPFKRFFNISLNVSYDKLIIELYNITGELVKCEYLINSENGLIDMSDYPPGIYIMRVMNNKFALVEVV